MNLFITNAGLLAAANAGTSGPLVNIAEIRVSEDGSVPASIDRTSVTAPIVDTIPLSFYNVIDANTVQFVTILDESRGDYTIREIGYYLDTGDLFAIGQPTEGIPKEAEVPSITPGNRLTITGNVTYNNIVSVIDFSLVLDGTVAQWANNFEAASYISPTQCSLVGDHTAKFHIGRAVRASQNSVITYSHIQNSVYSLGNTTITLRDSILLPTLNFLDFGIISAHPSGTSLPARTSRLTIDKLFLGAPQTIASSGVAGSLGQIAWDDNYIYIYTSIGWQRSPLSGAF